MNTYTNTHTFGESVRNVRYVGFEQSCAHSIRTAAGTLHAGA